MSLGLIWFTLADSKVAPNFNVTGTAKFCCNQMIMRKFAKSCKCFRLTLITMHSCLDFFFISVKIVVNRKRIAVKTVLIAVKIVVNRKRFTVKTQF